MNDFGKALKHARKTQRITLSQLSEVVSKSIGYLSDIEQSRKQPPTDKNLLVNIETALNIQPGYLCRLAEQVRGIPKNIINQSRLNPKLSEVLLRADRDLTEEEFEEVVKLLETYTKKQN
jgi:transcriptional regulator with XRE-family HTH domain